MTDYYSNLMQYVDIKTIVAQKDWYINAHKIADDIATLYGIPVFKVVGVIAALSPRNKWYRNIIDTNNLINAVINNLPLPSIATYGRQVKKAIDIINCHNQAECLHHIGKGLKTLSFYHNIMLDFDYVTIDIWIARAAGLCKYAPSKVEYVEIANTIKLIARELNIQPAIVQAGIWVAVRGQAE